MIKNKHFILFVCISIIIITAFVYIIIKSNNKPTIDDKVDKQISFIESNILAMLNNLNNIRFENTIVLQEEKISLNENEKETSSGNSDSSNSDSSNNSNNSNNNNDNSSKEENGSSSEFRKYTINNTGILNNNINNNEDNSSIDWDNLKYQVEILYSSWPTIMLDMHRLKLNNEDILNFSNVLNRLVISIDNKDKKDTLNNLGLLYSYLVNFTTDDDNIKKDIIKTKSYIVDSYILLEEENWSSMLNKVSSAQESFLNILNSVSINDLNKQNYINKTYIAINELMNIISLENKNLYYLKYVELMENILNI